MILNTKLLSKLEKRIEPSERIKRICNSFDVDWHDIDWKSTNELVKDYSSEKVFINEYLMPKILSLSTNKEKIQLYTLEKLPNKDVVYLEQEQQQKELLLQQEKTEKEYQDILEQIKTTPSPNIDKLTKQIREWIKLVLSDKTQKSSIVVLGRAGIGKTTIIKSVLREFFKPEQLAKIIFRGHLTPLAYYNILYDEPKGIFYFDDISGLYHSEAGISLLKDSTETESKKLVCYNSTSGKLEHRTSKFFFEGKQIFCMNTYPRAKNFLPIISRIRPIEFKPTYREILLIMYEIIKEDFKDIPLKEKIKIVEFIERNTNEATENFDLRLMIDFVDLYRYCGGINDKFVEMANGLLEVDEDKELVLELGKAKSTIKEQEKCFIEQTHKSRATFYNIRSEIGLARMYRKI
ncbi:MAG: hypothetical protein AABY22_32980 [Nanoarchaeota archaeon]